MTIIGQLCVAFCWQFSLPEMGLGVWSVAVEPGRVDPISLLALPGQFAGSVFEDREGNVWFGTSSEGLVRFRPPSFSTVGVEHGAGPKALDRLRDAGAPLPAGWRKVQDHAKNGIVAQPAEGESHAEVLRWLLDVCWALCPIDIEDHWLAEVHRPG